MKYIFLFKNILNAMIAERQLFALENSFLVCSHGSNEVGSNAEEGRKAEGDNWFIVAPRARQQ